MRACESRRDIAIWSAITSCADKSRYARALIIYISSFPFLVNLYNTTQITFISYYFFILSSIAWPSPLPYDALRFFNARNTLVLLASSSERFYCVIDFHMENYAMKSFDNTYVIQIDYYLRKFIVSQKGIIRNWTFLLFDCWRLLKKFRIDSSPHISFLSIFSSDKSLSIFLCLLFYNFLNISSPF